MDDVQQAADGHFDLRTSFGSLAMFVVNGLGCLVMAGNLSLVLLA